MKESTFPHLSAKELFDIRNDIESQASKLKDSWAKIANLSGGVKKSISVLTKKLVCWGSAYLFDYLLFRSFVTYLLDLNEMSGLLREIIYLIFPFVLLFLEDRIGKEIIKAQAYAEQHLNSARLRIFKAMAFVAMTIPLGMVASLVLASNEVTGALILVYIALGILATLLHAVIIFTKEFHDPTVSLGAHLTFTIHSFRLKGRERKFFKTVHRFLTLTGWEKGSSVTGMFSDHAKILVTLLVSKDVFPDTEIPEGWFNN